MRRAGLTMVAAALLGGCSLFHDSYPDKSCEGNTDCFLGREICDMTSKQCIAIDLPDAAGPPPDTGPQPDTALAPDAGAPDASPPDAEVSDAT